MPILLVLSVWRALPPLVLGFVSGFFLVPNALAQTGSDPLPKSFLNALLAGSALCILGLLVLLFFLKYRSRMQRQLAREREKAYQAVIQAQAMYQGLFEMAPVGIFRSSLDGSRYFAVNQATADLYGVESPEVMVETIRPLDLYPDAEVRRQVLEHLRTDGIIRNLELRLKRFDGKILNILLTIRMYAEEKFLEGCVVDVTDYRVAEKGLADKGRFLQALLDAMPTPLFYKDRGGRYRLVNEAFLDMMGQPSEAILDKTVEEISPLELARRYREMDEALLRAEGAATQRYESQIEGDQGVRDVVFNKQTVLDGEGRVEGLLGVITDISRVKRQQRQLEEQRALLEALFDSASEHIFFKSAEGVYLGCNERFASSLGMAAADIRGKRDAELFPPEMVERFKANDRVVLERMEPVLFDTDIELPHLGKLVMETVLAPMIGSSGEVIGVAGVARDVTERKVLEEELRAAEQRYRALFENAVEGIFTVAVGGRMINANPALARLFGFDSVEGFLYEVNDNQLELFDRTDDRPRLEEQVRSQGQVQAFQAQALRRDGSKFWMELNAQGVFDKNGELVTLEGIAKDVSQRRAAERALKHRASTDALTGLPNRDQLQQTCRHMLAQAERSGERVGVLFVDLDGFKAINDTWGHKVGDDLLIQVSDRLRQRLRQSDLASRLGGDEFAVLLWDLKDVESIRELGLVFLRTLTGGYQCDGKACALSASIGASMFPDHGRSMGELLEKADQAMYAVKKTGKNGFYLAGDENGPLLLEPESSCGAQDS